MAALDNNLGNEYFLKYYTSWKEKEKIYIVMEAYEETLKDIMNTHSSFNENEILKVILDVCNGLKTAHQNKIYHLNITPMNIILSKNGNFKLYEYESLLPNREEHFRRVLS